MVGVRIYHAPEIIRIDPRKHVKEMKRPGKEEPLCKFRVGDYRIIMSLFDDDLVILVVDIGPRKRYTKDMVEKGS